MRLNVLFFLTAVSCVCFALAQVAYDDCCLGYVKPLGPKTQKHAMKYRVQVVDGGCNIPAVIFTMKRGRLYCADPKEKWVTNLMERIDNRKTGGRRRPHPKRPSRG